MPAGVVIGDIEMILKRAFLFCEKAQTTDQLKAIMESHPSPLRYKDKCDIQQTEQTWGEAGMEPAYIEDVDSIYLGKWFSEWDCPTLDSAVFDICSDAHLRRRDQLEFRWWRVTRELLLLSVPEAYRFYSIFYGECLDPEELQETAAAHNWRSIIEEFHKPGLIAGLNSY
jgi:hypothetical protein